jgi:cytochrome d ubiquinol oxidase subunit II
VLVALGLVAGYGLLGSTWLMAKSEDQLHGDARRWAGVLTVVTALFLAAVSLATLFLHRRIAARWGVSDAGIDWGRAALLSPIPLLGVVGLVLVAWTIRRGSHRWPFVGAGLVFLSGYLGLAAGLAPFVVPYVMTIRDAASPPQTLAFLLIALAVILPIIIGYSAWLYWIFRGKVSPEGGYH